MHPSRGMADDWAERYQGAKQPWSSYLGDGWQDFDKIVRVRRECMDTCFSQWERDSVRQEPAILVESWRRLEAEMDEQIPHARSLWYEALCAEPEPVMEDVIAWLGGTGTIHGWGEVEPPKWMHRDYDTKKIHAARAGLWRKEPAFKAWQ